ncbi:MAG TPA: SRPBCC family protein [Verrucomicrobiae bacterium]|nr:SRPBCC family protein [Verrucomicrobiae bacterium]
MNVQVQNEIIIRAPLENIFQTTANLLLWPRVLPHYRWVRILEKGDDGSLVQMAAWRGWLPIQWTSRFKVDSAARELHFQHLKAFTRGMKVKWTYTPAEHGVIVRISHELNRWYAGLIARYFIHPVASRTLAGFKEYLERGDCRTSPSLNTGRMALSNQRVTNS